MQYTNWSERIFYAGSFFFSLYTNVPSSLSFSCCVWFLTNAHIEIHMCCRCWCCSLQAWMSKRVRGYLFQIFRCWEEGEYKIERKYKVYSQSFSKCILRSPRHFLKREARDRISSIVIVWIFAFKCCVYMCLLMCAYLCVRSNGWFDHHSFPFGVVLWGMHKDIKLLMYLYIWNTYLDHLLIRKL